MNNKPEQKKESREAKGKIFTGKVASVSGMPKTIVVTLTTTYRHPLYKKSVRRTNRFLVHNESLTLAVGDTVRIRESKPISKMKHFVVLEKVI